MASGMLQAQNRARHLGEGKAEVDPEQVISTLCFVTLPPPIITKPLNNFTLPMSFLSTAVHRFADNAESRPTVRLGALDITQMH